MGQLLMLFWGGFVLALSGAVMPGPVLTATISEVMKRGFRAGPLIVLGHGILEIALLIAVVAGLGPWITRDSTMRVLSLGGGALLLAMGVQMVATARKAADDALHPTADPQKAIRGPVLTGILTSLCNPYWSLWWAGIGLNWVAVALKSGTLGLASFYSGHILADLAWYSLISAAAASGRRICPRPVYIGLIVACGLLLVVLGIYFAAAGVRRFA